MTKKISNKINPRSRLPESRLSSSRIDTTEFDSLLYKNNNLVVDFSFEGAFLCFEFGDFSNYLMNEKDFIERYRMMMTDIQKLSGTNLEHIIQSSGYRHCHLVENKNIKKAEKIIRHIFTELEQDENMYDQSVGGENIYQIGWESEIRLFGTIHGNIFRVYFVDFYHDFNHDQRRNERNKKHCKFCPMKSKL